MFFFAVLNLRVVEGEDENPAVPGLVRLCRSLKHRDNPVRRFVGDHHLELRLCDIGRLAPHSPVDQGAASGRSERLYLGDGDAAEPLFQIAPLSRPRPPMARLSLLSSSRRPPLSLSAMKRPRNRWLKVSPVLGVQIRIPPYTVARPCSLVRMRMTSSTG